MSELKFTADIDVKILDQKLKKIEESFTNVARDAAQAGSVMDKVFKQAATDSINVMVLKLGELQKAYNDLSAADRATQGAGLTSEMNKLSVQIETAKNLFVGLEVESTGSIDSMVAKMGELNRQFTALSATDRGGSIGTEMQKEIQILAKRIEDAKGEFVSMEQVAEDSINGMINKLLELQRQYNNLSGADRVTIGAGIQKEIQGLSINIEEAKKQFVSLANVSEDSVSGMVAKLAELNKQFALLSAADRDGTIGVRMAQDMAALSNQIENVNLKMRAMNGQARTSTNSLYGLNYSVQQIGRELPNIAYGFPLFIMAISNNLPILADSITQARKENELLLKSNQQATPVWKQVAGAVFSWQTGMILAVTALTVFGGKIPGLISDLFRMKDGLKLTSEELKTLNESFAKAAGTEISKLKTLFDALGDAEEGTVEYADAKAKIIDQFGKNLEGMDAEIRTLQNQKAAYDELSKSIYETAKAKSLEELQAGLGEKLIKETTPKFEQLSKLLTGGVGEIYRETILDAARFGKELSIDAKRVIDGFAFKKRDVIGTSTSGAVQYGPEYEFNPVLDLMKQINKEQDDLNKAWKEGNDYADLIFGNNTQKKIKNLTKDAENALAAAKLMPQKDDADVKARNQAIDAAEKRLEYLKELGVEKDEKSKKANEELTKAKEALTKAVIDGDEKEIKFQAAKVALLQKELDLRNAIISSAIAVAENNQIKPIKVTTVGGTGKGFASVVSSDAEKIMKQEKDRIKKQGDEIIKVQKQIDKETEDAEKERLERYEDLLDYSRQFTGELIDQLGLSQDQAKELQGMADTFYNLAKGDLIGAGFSALSTVMSVLFSGSGKEDPTTKALENINSLLDQQSAILSNLAGSNYFDLAEKQYNDLGKAIDANTKKLKETSLLTEDQLGLLNRLNKEFATAATMGNTGLAKSIKNQMTELLSSIKNAQEDWNTKDILDSYSKGEIILNDAQSELVKSIIEAEKQRAELLQETFREALGFDSSDISDSIFSGIEEGLRLGEDGLGGFAQSFGDLMKKALMQSITDAMNLGITESFLPAYQEALKDGLTDEERANLESIYKSLVEKGQIDIANIKSITDKYGSTTKQSSITGVSASFTEDTLSAMVGQTMALRVDTLQIKGDIRTMLNFSQNQFEIMDQQLSTLNQIERNTRFNADLPNILNEVKETNRLIKAQG